MNVVICAAGLGSRFGAGIPKCLVDVRGKTFLQRQIEAIRAVAPSSRIHVVSGYKYDDVTAHLKALGFGRVSFIRNPFYECSGPLGSAWLALPYVNSGKVLRIDGDVLFCSSAGLEGLVNLTHCQVCVGQTYMKKRTHVVTHRMGQVDKIEMRDDYEGPDEWICVELYTGGRYQELVTEAVDLVGKDCYYFNALNRNIREKQWHPLVYKMDGVYEVDTPEDLACVDKRLSVIK